MKLIIPTKVMKTMPRHNPRLALGKIITLEEMNKRFNKKFKHKQQKM